ncbi:hypothetical protein RO575_19930 [Methylomonas sp. MO1]|uniref:hypothetical protein n=1 Tax=unclassified Methylomonas TaxID=2608980 RepID=UPI0005258C88|nr:MULTISPECIES: hypothetical protein [unclassified Methylomonas]MDT4291840.1 hypothetical protein [Methylomonas sp. MO1]
MAGINFTPALRIEYDRLFNTCIINAGKLTEVGKLCDQLIANRARYQNIGNNLGIPWFFIAVIHNMESSQKFSKHLHNGDPLTARTVQVPAGRPRTGNPPFTWEESASDALVMHNLNGNNDWSTAGVLYQLEAYNGWGYRKHHPEVLSPYLWSFSNHYSSGKYIADGTWSDTAISRQCGAAVLLRRMAELGEIDFTDQPRPVESPTPLVVSYSETKSEDLSTIKQAEDLQRWLNTFSGVFVLIDGVPGKKTSDAFKQVTGSFLPDDPRN